MLMSDKRIAVVTGANRGIGFEIARQLSMSDGLKAILTARAPAKGNDAAVRIAEQGGDVFFHQLDVTEEQSAKYLANFLDKEHGRCDILVNNAGVFNDQGKSGLDPDMEIIRDTFETNTMGPLRLCRLLVPLMIRNNYGRIVNMSSGMGQLSDMEGRWPGYRISKTALNAVTRIIAQETADHPIKVNSMCPGWVATDLGGENAPRTPEQAADTAVWLATLLPDGPTGGFFRDRQPLDW